MVLQMNKDVFITCAVTGSGNTQDKSRNVPRTPKEIAENCISASKAGASIVHCHVRDPETGKPSRDIELYKEVTDRVRSSGEDMLLNLTAGMGGDMVFGDVEEPLPLDEGRSDMVGATKRVEHLFECKPDIATLDCGTMNFSESDYVMTNTPGMLKRMAKEMTELGIKVEMEAFDTGHLQFAKHLVEEGYIREPALVQLCMGIRWGAPDNLSTFLAMVGEVPESWTWSGFSIGRHQMAYVAASVLAGGNVRVGLEDNLYFEKGVLATNAGLVERAVTLITNMGGRVMNAEETGRKLGIRK